MNRVIDWLTIKDSDMTQENYEMVAKLKEQYWPHGILSQIQWMKANLSCDDIHLIGKDRETGEIVAYSALVKVHLNSNNEISEYLGLGNVCVDCFYSKEGIGTRLIEVANIYIKNAQIKGILLCKDALVSFYEKCGWKTQSYDSIYIAGVPYSGNVMFLGDDVNIPKNTKIYIDKNF